MFRSSEVSFTDLRLPSKFWPVGLLSLGETWLTLCSMKWLINSHYIYISGESSYWNTRCYVIEDCKFLQSCHEVSIGTICFLEYIFWPWTLCSSVEVHWRFGWNYCLCLQDQITSLANKNTGRTRLLGCLTFRLWSWRQYIPPKRRWSCP
jgi:hypothetical protein